MWLPVLLILGGIALAFLLFKVSALEAEVARLKKLEPQFNELEHRFDLLVENRDEAHNGINWKALWKQALGEKWAVAWIHDAIAPTMGWGPILPEGTGTRLHDYIGDDPAGSSDTATPPTV
ncbi:MAG: hypothetical protein HY294_10105 [Candidatus Rokubacteria bacterium]|nr:hypothetical protein [Candidatus Rokubacteria bacterium]